MRDVQNDLAASHDALPTALTIAELTRARSSSSHLVESLRCDVVMLQHSEQFARVTILHRE